jgi:hypothetical protein
VLVAGVDLSGDLMPSTACARLELPSSLFLLFGLLVACGGDSDNGQEPRDPEPALVTATGEFPAYLAADGGTLFWSEAGEATKNSLHRSVT